MGSGLLRTSDRSDAERYSRYAGEPIDRFTTFGLDGWTAVSRNAVVVWNGINEAYLISVREPCSDLLFAERIGVTTTGRSVSKFENVRVGRDRCPIASIRPIDVEQMKADRAAAVAAEKGGR